MSINTVYDQGKYLKDVGDSEAGLPVYQRTKGHIRWLNALVVDIDPDKDLEDVPWEERLALVLGSSSRTRPAHAHDDCRSPDAASGLSGR